MNYFVIDCEGLTKKGNEPYNVGYCIVSDEGEVLVKRDFFFPKFMKQNVAAAFSKENFDYYMGEKDNPNREFTTIWNVDDFIKIYTADIKKYSARTFLAWNAGVDWNFLTALAGDYNVDLFFDRWYDISNAAALNKDYVDWCYETGNVSEKGYPRFNVDTCLKYFMKDNYRPEVHRGIDDCIDEAKIAFNFGLKDYQTWTTPAGQLWRWFK